MCPDTCVCAHARSAVHMAEVESLPLLMYFSLAWNSRAAEPEMGVPLTSGGGSQEKTGRPRGCEAENRRGFGAVEPRPRARSSRTSLRPRRPLAPMASGGHQPPWVGLNPGRLG